MAEPSVILILPAIWIPASPSGSLIRKTAEYSSEAVRESWPIPFPKRNIRNAAARPLPLLKHWRKHRRWKNDLTDR